MRSMKKKLMKKKTVIIAQLIVHFHSNNDLNSGLTGNQIFYSARKCLFQRGMERESWRRERRGKYSHWRINECNKLIIISISNELHFSEHHVRIFLKKVQILIVESRQT